MSILLIYLAPLALALAALCAFVGPSFRPRLTLVLTEAAAQGRGLALPHGVGRMLTAPSCAMTACRRGE